MCYILIGRRSCDIRSFRCACVIYFLDAVGHSLTCCVLRAIIIIIGTMEQDDSPGKSGSGGRLKSYKYKGLDAREMRRQREEEGVQLRKQKKEELVSNRN